MRTLTLWGLGVMLVAAQQASADANLGSLFGTKNSSAQQFQKPDMTNIAAPLPTSGSSVTLSGLLSKLNIPGLYKTHHDPTIIPTPMPTYGPLPVPANVSASSPYAPAQPIVGYHP